MSTILVVADMRLSACFDSPVGNDANSTSIGGRFAGSHFAITISPTSPIPGNFSASFTPAPLPPAPYTTLNRAFGAHTIWFAQAVAPNGVVLAFEPQRLVYQTLCANIAVNSLKNVVCHQVAVGDEEGELTVPVLDPMSPGNFGGLEIQGHETGEP